MAQLVDTRKAIPLPLKHFEFTAEVKGYVAGLKCLLRYSNDSDSPAEVVFRFPVEQSYAVVGLTAVVDGRRVTAQLREKEEARAIYDDALASGQTAALGEEASGDVFSVTLGNLPPRKEAEIHLRLVGELPVDAEGGGGPRFSLPVALKPRYTPAGSSDPLAPVQGGDASNGQVERAGGPTPAGAVDFVMTVLPAADVEAVTSPTHALRCEENGNHVTVTLTEGNLEKDLVVLIKYREPHRPAAIVEGGAESDGTEKGYITGPAVMLSFYPHFSTVEAAGEFIFLVDRSGSMSGAYIRSARETLDLFLKSLSEGCYFNIIGFGTNHENLFPESVPYDQSSLSKAVSHVQAMEADLGGTELLPPLQHVFSSLKLRPGMPRQVFVLTDGSVSNTEKCVECVRKNAHTARCFTFGIGSGASTALVEGLAKAGGGTFEYVKEGERMQAKVIRSLKRALQPAVTDVSVKFKVHHEYEVLTSPQTIPPVFNGERLVTYGILKKKATAHPHASGTAVLKGTILGSTIEHTIPFDIVTTPSSLPTIHHLAAKALIKDWELEDRPKADVVEMSKEMGVVSKYTAFVAVDEGNREPVKGSMKTWDIVATGDAIGMDGVGAVYSGGMSSGNRVADLNSVMRQNIQGVLKRGEQLSDLDVKAEHLSQQAAAFQTSARHVKKSGGFFSGLFSSLFGSSGNTSSSVTADSYSETLDSYCVTSDSYGWNADSYIPSMEFDSSEAVSTRLPQAQANLAALIALQQADGSWNLDDAFALQVGKGRAELEGACPGACVGVMRGVWATILALCTLRVRYSDKEEEWELLAKKADGWVKRQSLPSGVTVEGLHSAATKFV